MRSSVPERAPVFIVGYGNPLRCDDGVGWRAAATLAGRVPGATVLVRRQLGPELAPELASAAYAVFIDARIDAVPGGIAVQCLKPDAAGAPPLLTHHLPPSTLLAFAHILYGRCPRATLFTVAGRCFDHGRLLSAPVRLALPFLLDLIVRDVAFQGTVRR